MNYISVYSTRDKSEVSVLKNLFAEEKIDFRIEDEGTAMGDPPVSDKRFMVAEKDRKLARELLHQTGFVKEFPHERRTPRRPMKRWMFLFLAALVLVVVAIIVWWFMSAP
ncbi:putative signal transducing protein [Salinimicrobium flavum]|uniref:DUF2007 domain-containing protein n=1 Tax=Salinimicrobium flavum TaxID=1737065 RepID=A0ABW5IUL3_9FLAO